MAYYKCNGGGSSDVYYLGAGTSFDIKSKFPNDYQKFTVDNFIIGISYATGTSGSYEQWGRDDVNAYPSKSYDATTGVFSIGGTYARYNPSAGGYVMCTIYPTAYLIMGKLKSI